MHLLPDIRPLAAEMRTRNSDHLLFSTSLKLMRWELCLGFLFSEFKLIFYLIENKSFVLCMECIFNGSLDEMGACFAKIIVSFLEVIFSYIALEGDLTPLLK